MEISNKHLSSNTSHSNRRSAQQKERKFCTRDEARERSREDRTRDVILTARMCVFSTRGETGEKLHEMHHAMTEILTKPSLQEEN
ncbi:hypothetical protein NDU88_002673 [Pleurodeles waltl]|uniref:Uncharacterized protein n=1 Tax=Pleurodeles waltl TaxID=8319 RepID=A0AAV7SF80_PLEWA|nr:hypothetical protein NDU88_002673 [Pleurodeles waltl]